MLAAPSTRQNHLPGVMEFYQLHDERNPSVLLKDILEAQWKRQEQILPSPHWANFGQLSWRSFQWCVNQPGSFHLWDEGHLWKEVSVHQPRCAQPTVKERRSPPTVWEQSICRNNLGSSSGILSLHVFIYSVIYGSMGSCILTLYLGQKPNTILLTFLLRWL